MIEDNPNNVDALKAEQRKAMVLGITSVLFYGSLTTSMVFLNKAVLSN